MSDFVFMIFLYETSGFRSQFINFTHYHIKNLISDINQGKKTLKNILLAYFWTPLISTSLSEFESLIVSLHVQFIFCMDSPEFFTSIMTQTLATTTVPYI